MNGKLILKIIYNKKKKKEKKIMSKIDITSDLFFTQVPVFQMFLPE